MVDCQTFQLQERLRLEGHWRSEEMRLAALARDAERKKRWQAVLERAKRETEDSLLNIRYAMADDPSVFFFVFTLIASI